MEAAHGLAFSLRLLYLNTTTKEYIINNIAIERTFTLHNVLIPISENMKDRYLSSE